LQTGTKSLLLTDGGGRGVLKSRDAHLEPGFTVRSREHLRIGLTFQG
jgi:hypothetical protein